MKKLVSLLFVLLFVGFTANAQDYTKVDNTVKAYPKFSTLEKFADQVKADFTAEDDKARAIFTWLALNVKYDMAAYNTREMPVAFSYRTQEEKIIKERKFKDDLALKTLKSRKGVCQGYSTLFEAIAERVGLQAVIIPGTSKSHPTHIGKLPTASDHAWNAVKISGQWRLVDATWGAGTVTGNPPQFGFRFNDSYFLTDPADFVLNHYPDDEKWLLTNATKEDFADMPLYYGNYLMGGYEFVSPDAGVYANTKSVLPFKIKHLKKGDKIGYAFSNNRVLKEVTPKQNGELAEFDVPIDKTSNGYLTIYINQKSVAAYRINRT